MSIRKIKNRLKALLTEQVSIETVVQELTYYPHRKVVNPLFSFFYSGSSHVKWRAISTMGRVVSLLADEDMESARVIMRRLMWNLNDESGGIGWGSPEALGEIMALNETVAHEFSAILISYMNPCGNFLEHEILQRGLLWGFERLSNTRTHLAEEGGPYLFFYLSSKDPIVRGLAVRAAIPLLNPHLKKALEPLIKDSSTITFYEDERFKRCTIGAICQKAFLSKDPGAPSAL